MLVTGSWILDGGYWILVEKTRKRAEGMISRSGEITDTKSFHKAGRDAGDAEGNSASDSFRHGLK